MSSETHSTFSALHEILKWSISRPEWQRDALRRIVVKGGVIDEADLKDLNQLCRIKHFCNSTIPTMKAEPLAKEHLPPEPGSETSVTLLSIGNLQHVNRIPPDQMLAFGTTPGLTVIYGDNGSGKSGYARVIKKACRARGVPPVIRPNAFEITVARAASADIVCRVDNTDVPVTWTDGVTPDPRLGNVFVFDASSAGHYLQEDGPATFTPYGLDILPMLSKVCDSVRAFIQRDIDSTKDLIANTVKNWKYAPTTAVGKLVGGLSAATKASDVDELSGLDVKQTQRLKDLHDALKSDPKQKAKETRAAATRLKTFTEKIAITSKELSDKKIESLRKLIDYAKATADSAKAFATRQFDSTYLPGTGSEIWRKMWDAANAYSMSAAYKEKNFPVTENLARCVLCQQDLGPAAIERFKALEIFCKDHSQNVAASAAKHLKDEIDSIARLALLSPELDKVEADLDAMTAEQRGMINEFVKKADECLVIIKDNLARNTWTDPVSIPTSPAAAIISVESTLQARAKTEESADDSETRKKLDAERNELEAREWLAGVKVDVLLQIERYNLVKMLEECKRDTATTTITTQSTDLTRQLVTEVFCEQFKKEVKALGLRTLEVKLDEIKGAKGETKFGLRLASSTHHKVVEIASEGEQRCIALAAFLAELSQSSHKSSLVFDDPVSSLDHWHREKIAARLVEASKTRQVIVFTHDAVFLNDLQSCATRDNVVSEVFHLEWSGNIPGRCVKGLPWDLKSADDRFDKLEKEQKAIAKVWNQVPNEDNVQAMRHAYSWLRATLERIVEKEVFADVVFRFRSYVDVKKLNGVIGFTQAECKELQRLVQRCHDVTDAHDAAQAKHAAIPEPADLLRDIEAAKQLLATIRSRRKSSGVIPVTHQLKTPGT